MPRFSAALSVGSLLILPILVVGYFSHYPNVDILVPERPQLRRFVPLGRPFFTLEELADPGCRFCKHAMPPHNQR